MAQGLQQVWRTETGANRKTIIINNQRIAGIEHLSTPMLVRKIRKSVFVLINVILRPLIWPTLLILRPFHLIDYLFLVYPGTDYDLDGYCPRWLARSWLFFGRPVTGGIITRGETGVRGLILVVPNTARQMLADKSLVLDIVNRLNSISTLVGANTVAMAGQLPSIVEKHGIDTDQKFVNGKLGTVFAIESTLEKVLEKEVVPGNPTIAVIGTGFIGEAVLENQKRKGRKVVGFNIDSDAKDISGADIVIVLTPRGKDFMPYVPHLQKGAIIIDDTHPRIFAKIDNATLYKVAMSIERVQFLPKLPGYKFNWVPGCAIEAILQARFGHDTIVDPERAKLAAEKIGLRPILVN